MVSMVLCGDGSDGSHCAGGLDGSGGSGATVNGAGSSDGQTAGQCDSLVRTRFLRSTSNPSSVYFLFPFLRIDPSFTYSHLLATGWLTLRPLLLPPQT